MLLRTAFMLYVVCWRGTVHSLVGERARESRKAPYHLPRESSEESRSITREPPHSGPPDPQKQRTPCDPLRPTCRPLVDPTCWSLVSLI